MSGPYHTPYAATENMAVRDRKESEIERAKGRTEEQIAMVEGLLHRAHGLADRLLGSVPVAGLRGPADGAEIAPDGMVHRLTESQHRLLVRLSQLSSALDRLEEI